MFILIISRGFPQPGSPLRGIFEFDQAKALTDAGHNVVLLSVDLRSIRRRRKMGKSHLHKDGIEIVNISVPVGRVPAWLFLLIGRMALKSLYRDVRKIHGKPDLIHAHFHDIAAMTAGLDAVRDVPFVVTEHSSKLTVNNVDKKTGYFCRFAYAKAHTVITVSESLAKRLQQHYNVESIVIPNIVDTSTFQYKPTIHEGFRFVAVGNLIYRKGFDVLIQAFGKLNSDKCRLVIVGEGPERENLNKLIYDLGLQRQVVLVGQKSRKEINNIMNRSDAFVLASRSETFGVVYIEAMAAGLPIIATKCGGPEAIVNESNGMMVAVNNVEQLAQSMKKMITQPLTFDKKHIAESCVQRYGPEIIAQMLSRVYSELRCCNK